MIKRVNSTGRRRIPADRIAIEVYDGDPRTFDAAIDLATFEAPEKASVVLEATCAGSTTTRRFDWGMVGKLAAPDNRELRDLHGANVFFSLKVIDRSERFGRILGLAENIRPIKAGPKTAAGRKGILPVEKSDLGQELWRLEFRTEDVFLIVNEKIPGLVDRVRFDAGIFSLIYPTIIRMVLNRALEEIGDEEEDSDRWPSHWIRFAKRLHSNLSSPPDSEEEEERDEWIEDVVTSFCTNHKLREKFIQVTGSSGAWEESV